MCNPFSCIVNKQGKIFWSEKTQSHEDIIKNNNLYDGQSNWAKVEITNDDIFDSYFAHWKLGIDKERKPEWFSDEHEKACFVALAEWHSKCVFVDKKDIICTDTMTWHKNGSSSHNDNAKSSHYGNAYAIGKKVKQRVNDNAILRLSSDNNVIVTKCKVISAEV